MADQVLPVCAKLLFSLASLRVRLLGETYCQQLDRSLHRVRTSKSLQKRSCKDCSLNRRPPICEFRRLDAATNIRPNRLGIIAVIQETNQASLQFRTPRLAARIPEQTSPEITDAHDY